MKLPPGPRPLFPFQNLVRYSRNPLTFFEQITREHGDFAYVPIPGYSFYLINNRACIEEVLKNKGNRFIKDKTTRALSRLIGNGLVISEGEYWQSQRKAIQPTFHPHNIADWANCFVQYSRDSLDSWEDGKTIILQHEMMKITLRIIARIIFNVDVAKESSQVGEAMQFVTTYFVSLLNVIIPGWLPTPANLKVKPSDGILDDLIRDFERKAAKGQPDSVTMLGLLQQAGMKGPQLRDELMTFLLAGHETTSFALTYTIYLLSKHPEIRAKVMAEIQTVTGDRPVAARDARSFPYLKCVFQESLRLYPPVWSIARESIKDCELGGYPIPAHSQIVFSQWNMHRDPRYFQDPLKFDPDRWKTLTEHDLSFVYFPFGAGPRICIGKEFATMEAILILATLYQKCELEVLHEGPLELIPSITIRPRHPLNTRIHKLA